MKKIIYILLLAILIFTQFLAFSADRLLLHFDVDRTILLKDKTDKKLEDKLMHLLSDKYMDKWDERVKEPISFTDYVNYYLLDGDWDDQLLKARRYKQFYSFLDYLKERNHPLAPEVEAEYRQLLGILAEQDTFVFLSFYRLLDYLKKNKIDYSVFLRTYGSSLDTVVDEVHRKINPKFFSAKGRFEEGKLFIEHPFGNELCFEHPSEIYALLKTQHSLAIKDDYLDWAAHDEEREYGKKFPLDLSDESVISIFFDDKILKNTVYPIDAKTGKPLDFESLLEKNHLIVVDTTEALLDDNYFVKKIQAHLP